MNKTSFIAELANRTELTVEQAALINEIFENHFFLHKKNESKIINEISETLSIDGGKAKEIYNIAYDLIGNALVDKLKHPFGSQN